MIYHRCRTVVTVLLIAAVLLVGIPAAAEQTAARVPRFSHPSGFYPREFSLVLTAPAPVGTIYYTLDGSEPTEESRVYTGPIPIVAAPDHDGGIAYIETTMARVPAYMQWREPAEEPFKATVVRARYITAGEKPSPVVTQTYFTDPDISSRFTMPVIAVATDPENLFSHETGIYVPGKVYSDNDSDRWVYGQHPANYNQRGVEWERSAHMAWFNPQGTMGFEQEIGLRIHGAWSRVQPMKSLRMYARTAYGEGSIQFPFFAEGEVRTYERLLLRNAGQDFYFSFMRDVFGQSLVGHLDLDVQDARPVVVFINGVYWGIHYVRERYDERYIEKYYGIDREQVVLMENNSGLLAGHPEDRLLWYELRDYLFEHSLAEEDHYQKVLEQIDLENYLDYLLISIYSCNRDWPGNNVRYWRIREPVQTGTLLDYADGRWRWLINDLDVGFGVADYNMYELLTRESTAWPTPAWSTIMFRRMMENEGFRIRYLNRLDYHLHTTFSTAHGLHWIDFWQKTLRPEMAQHISRWRRPGSVDSWISYVDSLRVFVEERPDHLRSQTEAFFGLESSPTLTVQTDGLSGGYVSVNGILLADSGDPWTGQFFGDTPVQLQAIPSTGYAFKGWETNTGEWLEGEELAMAGDMVLRPVFVRQFWAELPFILLAGLVALGALTLWVRRLLQKKRERAHEQLLWADEDPGSE